MTMIMIILHNEIQRILNVGLGQLPVEVILAAVGDHDGVVPVQSYDFPQTSFNLLRGTIYSHRSGGGEVREERYLGAGRSPIIR